MHFLLLLASLFFQNHLPWLNNFQEAQTLAKEKKESILLNFSGSDWCGPCIQMKNEIFSSTVFLQFADENLVLVNADFPRSKKNKLSATQVKHNELLADRYNPQGKFPYTILLDAEGKILQEWDGMPDGSPELFVQQLTQSVHAINRN